MSDGHLLALPFDGPVGGEEFAEMMSAITFPRNAFRICVAVSGGADSMALCLLLKAWVKAKGGELFAVTVDHGLRPESGAEANWVHARLVAEGVEHDILRWRQTGEEKGSTQVQARTARYDLIAHWCREKEISFLALAHHQDDQIETFLMRLIRHSGPDGLAGMSMQRSTGEMTLIRPLLGLSKKRLLTTLREGGWGWIEEPSNHKNHYLRNRLRRSLPLLQTQGAKKNTLVSINRSLGRIRRALQNKTDDFIDQRVKLHPAGYAEIDFDESENFNPEILFRVLERILLTISGGNYSPRSKKTERLVQAVLSKSTMGSTLAGCQITLINKRVFIARENRMVVGMDLRSGTECLWDNRFFVHVHDKMNVEGLILKALGEKGWHQLCQLYPQVKESPIPSSVRYSLPAIFHGDKIITAPHLEYLNSAWVEKLQIKMRFEPKNMLIQLPFTVA